MIPAKNRDRKCSTCRHYQPSPLWRKGWCRNPLLYDRNTNHLVEADSLACNRTFIDYWEPIQGPVPDMAPQARSAKPRIAPSIPMGTMDSAGNRGVTTGNTPASGMAAVAQAAAPRPGREREVPKLALVTPDYEPGEAEPPEEASKVTRKIDQVAGPDVAGRPLTARERIRQARKQNSLLNSTRGRILIIAAVLLLLAAAVGGIYLLSKNKGSLPASAAQPTTTSVRPAPTPTGLGDATATPVAAATPVPPAVGVIGVNGWVQVKVSGGLSMRDAAKKSGKKLAVLPDGSQAHVVDGPKDADGFTWWKLDVAGKGTGWCAGQYLVAIPPPK